MSTLKWVAFAVIEVTLVAGSLIWAAFYASEYFEAVLIFWAGLAGLGSVTAMIIALWQAFRPSAKTLKEGRCRK